MTMFLLKLVISDANFVYLIVKYQIMNFLLTGILVEFDCEYCWVISSHESRVRIMIYATYSIKSGLNLNIFIRDSL